MFVLLCIFTFFISLVSEKLQKNNKKILLYKLKYNTAINKTWNYKLIVIISLLVVIVAVILTSIAWSLVVVECESDGAATATGLLSNWDAVMLTSWTDRRLTSGCIHATRAEFSQFIIIIMFICQATFTRYNLLSNRLSNRLTTGCLSNRIDNQLYRVYSRMSNPLYNPVWQPAVSCKQTSNRSSSIWRHHNTLRASGSVVDVVFNVNELNIDTGLQRDQFTVSR